MNLLEATLEAHNGGHAVKIGEEAIAVRPDEIAARPGLAAYAGKEIVLGIRPEDLEDAALQTGSADEQRLHGTVELIEALGSEIVVHFTIKARHAITEEVLELADDVGDLRALNDAAEGDAATLVGRFGPRSRARPAARSRSQSTRARSTSSTRTPGSGSARTPRRRRDERPYRCRRRNPGVGAAVRDVGVPLRPRRRADADRGGARAGVEADVRRVPAHAGRAGRGALRPLRRRLGLRHVRRRRAAPRRRARLPRLAGIALPEGDAADPPAAETVHGLGSRKNELLLELLERDGVEAYEGSVRYVHAARDAGLGRAVVSSGANCREVLEAADIADLFEVRIDGVVAERQGLRGKPFPDAFIAAARALGVVPARAAVFEDALAGGRSRPCGRVRPRRGRRPRRPGGRPARARRRPRRRRPGRAAPMIDHPAFAAEPWSLRETYLDLEVLAQTESLFALTNGHIGLRANLDEGEPFGLPGTYLNSFSERRPLPYAEAGYGYPESSETIVNVTNGKIVRLLVNDEPFDVRYGEVLSHERELDLRAGVLRRRAEWRSPAGATVRVTSTRLVSLVQRATAAILYEVQALDGLVRVVVQSEFVANEAGGALEADPRAAAVLGAPCSRGTSSHRTLASCLRTRRSGADC
jgi:HAD superfamily hydrolase (TIGR01509 family)